MTQNLQRQEIKDLRKKLVTELAQAKQKRSEQFDIICELCIAQNALSRKKAGREAHKMIQTLIDKINIHSAYEYAYAKVFALSLGTKERNERAKKLMKALGWKKGPTAHLAAMQPKWRKNLFIRI